jgi:hypothetical protein
MCKFVLTASIVVLSSCVLPKYKYYFESSNALPNGISNRVETTSLMTRADLTTSSLDLVIYEGPKVVIDTGIVSVDSLPRKKPGAKPSPQSEKAKKKQLYEEKKKAYLDAKKAYGDTKNKALDGFAIAAPILFTIAFFCLPYPPAAVVFAILGLFAGVLGMKSGIWGLALASLIAASVILVLYIWMTLLLGALPG